MCYILCVGQNFGTGHSIILYRWGGGKGCEFFFQKRRKNIFFPSQKGFNSCPKMVFRPFFVHFFRKKEPPQPQGSKRSLLFPGRFPRRVPKPFYRLMIRCLLTHLLLLVVIPIIYTPPLSLAVPRCSNVAPCASMVSNACPKAL